MAALAETFMYRGGGGTEWEPWGGGVWGWGWGDLQTLDHAVLGYGMRRQWPPHVQTRSLGIGGCFFLEVWNFEPNSAGHENVVPKPMEQIIEPQDTRTGNQQVLIVT